MDKLNYSGKQPSYGNQNQPLYGHMQDQAPAQEQSLYGDREEQGQSLYGDAQDHGQAWYGGAQGPSTYGDAQGPSAYGDTQGPSSFGDAQGPSFYEQDLSLNADRQEYDSYNHFRDTLDSGPTDFPPDAGPSVYPGVAAPVPQWIEDAPDEGISIIDQGNGLSPPALDLALIQQGQIPPLEVTMGPAQTTTTCTVWHANMPPTPAVAEQHETPSDATDEMLLSAVVSQNVIHLTLEVISQTMKSAKVLVTQVVFSKNAMVCLKKKKWHIIDKVIRESVPQFFRPNAVFQEFITSAHHQVVSNALSARCRKMIKFTHEGCCAARVNIFICGDDPLVFMHNIFFDENGNMIIHMKFQSCFVMANSPLKAIKYVLCIAGAATHCALHEQGKHLLEVDPFGGQIHQSKFNEILNAIDRLTPAEKAELKQYLQYVLVIGPSQA
ncbi:uncharacterized protein BJ212DRAFT_1478184 [Suillus subaureus]|uniref:Uncharacterized protein n=1 Tax=Suillus subaureus TaxID=48587 RepID=A0A9P7EGP0_9AGAM|nr:uncharacterized protein BJ212DRAFT_1478184 [Suillus subaureus]KAG1821088.1 hypothetical protein BJ212DRAFT_1478184 [Suillus subaureus]